MITAMKKRAFNPAPTESDFESNFLQYAMKSVTDRAPALTPYMKGFEIIDTNEDKTQACGVFGYQLGKQLVFVPVFFHNGKLKGQELLWLSKENRFVPTTDGWVQSLLGREPVQIGDGAPRPNASSFTPVDLRPTFRAPGKYANYSGCLDVNSILPMFAAARKTASVMGRAVNKLKQASLENTLRDNPRFVKIATRWATRHPAVAAGICQFYGADFLDKMAMEGSTREDLLGGTPFESLVEKIPPLNNRQRPDVDVILNTDIKMDGSDEYDGETRADAMLRGMTIRDKRQADRISKAFDNAEVMSTFYHPQQAGRYTTITATGEKLEIDVWPITFPTCDESKPGLLVIPVGKPEQGKIYGTEDVIVVGTGEPEQPMADLSGITPSSVQEDETYCLVGPHGASPTFQVWNKNSVGPDSIASVSWDYIPSVYRGFERSCPPLLANTHDGFNYDRLIFDGTDGINPLPTGSGTLVPKDWKLVRLYDRQNRKQPTALANLRTIHDIVVHNLPVVPIARMGEYYQIGRDGQKTANEVVKTLVMKHGLDGDTAQELVKRARLRPVDIRIKHAIGYPNNGYANDDYPAAPVNHLDYLGLTTDTTRSGRVVPAQLSSEMHQVVDPGRYDGKYTTFADPDPDATALKQLQQAGQQGQKEVFDVSMLRELYRTVRHEPIIDETVRKLNDAVDGLGLLRFQFLSQPDDFAERYGENVLTEFDSSTLNHFEGLGEFVLFLQEKNIGNTEQDLTLNSVRTQ